eukprot:15531092-Heterocapsa_arctica.AAC.1
MPEEEARALRRTMMVAWGQIVVNLNKQFPLGRGGDEILWIQSEIGGDNDADIIAMASSRTDYLARINGITERHEHDLQ